MRLYKTLLAQDLFLNRSGFAMRNVQQGRAIFNGQLNEVHGDCEDLLRSPEGIHSRSTTQQVGSRCNRIIASENARESNALQQK